QVEQSQLKIAEVPVGPLEPAGVLGGVAGRGRPPASLDELVPVALVVEPRQVARAAGDFRRVGQLAEVGGLAGVVAATEDEPGRVVELQVVDEGREEDRLPGPARPDDADAALDRLPPERTHTNTRNTVGTPLFYHSPWA